MWMSFKVIKIDSLSSFSSCYNSKSSISTSKLIYFWDYFSGISLDDFPDILILYFIKTEIIKVITVYKDDFKRITTEIWRIGYYG